MEGDDIQTLFKDAFKGKIKEKYHFCDKLSSGGFGIVYLAEDRKTKEKFAIKAIQKKSVKDLQTFVNEVKILQALDHPNIIKLYEIWEWNEVCFLVLEYCDGGELFQYIIDNKFLSEDVAAFIMKQLFQALEYLHNRQISHRDIKPENFMLCKKNDLACIKMIDFGLSKDFTGQNMMTTMSGSPYYIAPEVFLQKYNQKIDIWSMGVVLYIMLSGKVPFPGKTESEIMSNVMRGEFHFNHPAFQKVSEESKDLIRKCLVKDINKRLSATQALSHTWFESKGAMTSHNELSATATDQNEVLQGISDVMKANFKDAAYNYLSQKVNPLNVQGLYQALQQLDQNGTGFLPSDQFVRCLSQTYMKVTDREVEVLVEQMEKNNLNMVNYKDFLKYSYLCKMYFNHMKLEIELKQLDSTNKGMITVRQLDELLQNSDQFSFPPNAIDQVFTEMLGTNVSNVDRNCIIKIEPFLESLRSQFDQ